MKKKSIIVIWVLAIVVVMSVVIFSNYKSERKSELLEELYAYQGYTRMISEKEFEFYRYFVERDLQNNASENEVIEKVKEYAGKVNAIFFLGNKLGLCEPYSFEALELRMEQENQSRKIKLENGEIIYGPEQFSIETLIFSTVSSL